MWLTILFLHNQKINTIVVLQSKNAWNLPFPYPRLLDITRQGIVFKGKLASYTSNNNNYFFKVGVPNSSRLINANHFDTMLSTNETE